MPNVAREKPPLDEHSPELSDLSQLCRIHLLRFQRKSPFACLCAQLMTTFLQRYIVPQPKDALCKLTNIVALTDSVESKFLELRDGRVRTLEVIFRRGLEEALPPTHKRLVDKKRTL
jgi:hypothetical protein